MITGRHFQPIQKNALIYISIAFKLSLKTSLKTIFNTSPLFHRFEQYQPLRPAFKSNAISPIHSEFEPCLSNAISPIQSEFEPCFSSAVSPIHSECVPDGEDLFDFLLLVRGGGDDQ